MFSPQFSSDGAILAFLKPVNGISELYAVDMLNKEAASYISSSMSPFQSRSPTATTTPSTSSEDPQLVFRVIAPQSGGDTEANLTLQEKLRRERTRQLSTGITSFSWIPGTHKILFPQRGDLLTVDVVVPSSSSSSSTTPLAEILYDKTSAGVSGGVIDPKPSPDGTKVAFVQDNELYVLDINKATTTTTNPSSLPLLRLTHGASGCPGYTNGLADYIAEEEFDRMTGYWWSPDSQYIAFQFTDSSMIPEFRIVHAGNDDPSMDEVHRYPFAGKENARVKLGVLNVQKAIIQSSSASSSSSSGSSSTTTNATPFPVVWMNLGEDEDLYLARVNWIPTTTTVTTTTDVKEDDDNFTAPALAVQLLNREQTVLDVVRYNALTGKGTLMLREMNVVSPPPPADAENNPSSSSSSNNADGTTILVGNGSSSSSSSLTAHWVNVNDFLTFLPVGTQSPQDEIDTSSAFSTGQQQSPPTTTTYFLWGSERSGYTHLHLYTCPLTNKAFSRTPAYVGVPKSPFSSTPKNKTMGQLMVSSSMHSSSTIPALSSFSKKGDFAGCASLKRRLTGGQWIVEAVVYAGRAPCAGNIGGSRARSTSPSISNSVFLSTPRTPATPAAASSSSSASFSSPSSSSSSSSSEWSVFFTGTLDGPLERHLYSVPIFAPGTLRTRSNENSTHNNNNENDDANSSTLNSEPLEAVVVESIYGIPGCKRLTSGAGMHMNAVVSPDGKAFADTLSCLHAPPSLTVYRFDPSARFPASSPISSFITSPSSASGSSRIGSAYNDGRFVSPSAEISNDEQHTSMGSQQPSSWPVQNIVSFERTGGYGPRTSVGVSLVVVAHGALPTCSGTPPIYASYKQQLHALVGLLSSSSSSSKSSGRGAFGSSRMTSNAIDFDAENLVDLAALKQLAAPVSSAVSTFAAAFSSTLDTFKADLGFGNDEGAGVGEVSLTSPKSGSASVVGKKATTATTSASSSSTSNGAGSSSSSSSATPAAPSNGGAAAAATGGFSFDSFGSSLLNFGAQAGAIIAGMGVGTPSASTTSSADNNNDGNLTTDELVVNDLTTKPPSPPSSSSSGSRAIPITPAPSKATQPQSSSSSASSSTAAAASTPATTSSPSRPSPPLIVTLLAADNVTQLYASILFPDPEVFGPGPYPTILSVYGGPHVQRVKHDWATGSEVRAQALRKEGFLVVACDNRGGSRRGAAFEAHLRWKMGTVEVADQVQLVRALVAARLTDGDRVGLYGWSYGGYLTLMCLAKAPDVFWAGVAGAPVTSWDGYDTGYTERYMGTPASNPLGYTEGSIMTHAHRMIARPFIVHGLIDENVHVRHSFRLMNTLVSKNIPYDFLPLPEERHAPRGDTAKQFMESRIREYFRRHLMK